MDNDEIEDYDVICERMVTLVVDEPFEDEEFEDEETESETDSESDTSTSIKTPTSTKSPLNLDGTYFGNPNDYDDGDGDAVVDWDAWILSRTGGKLGKVARQNSGASTSTSTRNQDQDVESASTSTGNQDQNVEAASTSTGNQDQNVEAASTSTGNQDQTENQDQDVESESTSDSDSLPSLSELSTYTHTCVCLGRVLPYRKMLLRAELNQNAVTKEGCKPILLRCCACFGLRSMFPGDDESAFDDDVIPSDLKFSKCKNAPNGCTSIVKAATKEKHEDQCKFQLYACPGPVGICDWKGQKAQVVPHLLTHSVQRLTGQVIMFAAYDRTPRAFWYIIQTYLKRDFIIFMKRDNAHKLMVVLRLIGCKKDAKHFMYKIELVNDKRSSSYVAPAKGISDHPRLAESLTDCFIIDACAAKLFSTDGELQMKVSIYFNVSSKKPAKRMNGNGRNAVRPLSKLLEEH